MNENFVDWVRAQGLDLGKEEGWRAASEYLRAQEIQSPGYAAEQSRSARQGLGAVPDEVSLTSLAFLIHAVGVLSGDPFGAAQEIRELIESYGPIKGVVTLYARALVTATLPDDVPSARRYELAQEVRGLID